MPDHAPLYERVFPAALPVIALPRWSRPRLLIAGNTPRERWQGAALYPAFRLRARLLRWMMRINAAAGVGRRRLNPASPDVACFAQRIWHDARPAALLIGTASRVQKFTVQFRNPGGEIVGYIKLAQQPQARIRLEHEYSILQQLPRNLGPRALAHETLGDLDALAMTPVIGERLVPTRIIPPGLEQLLNGFQTGGHAPADRHPWLVALQQRAGVDIKPWVAKLSTRDWPIVIQHGDLAPWNLIHQANGTLAAIDWEEGDPQGFPHVDLTHMLLQIAMLIARRPAERAMAQVCAQLQRQPWPGLTATEADAIVRLTAHADHLASAAVGDHTPAQPWRQQLWEAST